VPAKLILVATVRQNVKDIAPKSCEIYSKKRSELCSPPTVRVLGMHRNGSFYRVSKKLRTI